MVVVLEQPLSWGSLASLPFAETMPETWRKEYRNGVVVVVPERMLMKIFPHFFSWVKEKSYDILCWRIIPQFFEISLRKRS